MSQETVPPEIKLRGITSKLSVTIESILMNIVFFSSAEQYEGEEESEYLKLKRATFGTKLRRTRELLEKYHSDLHKKYKPTLNLIDTFITFRNRITHCGMTWKDRKAETFIIWDVKENQSKYEELNPIEYNLFDSYTYLNEMMVKAIPPLQALSSEVQARLKISDPSLYALLRGGYDSPETT